MRPIPALSVIARLLGIPYPIGLVLGAIPLGYVPGVPHVELAQPRWGGLWLSANGVWRVLRRHGLNTRAKPYGLVASYVAPPPHNDRSHYLSGTSRSITQ